MNTSRTYQQQGSKVRYVVGDNVAMAGDTQRSGTVVGVGPGEVKVRWNHQPDAEPNWVPVAGVVHLESRPPRHISGR